MPLIVVVANDWSNGHARRAAIFTRSIGSFPDRGGRPTVRSPDTTPISRVSRPTEGAQCSPSPARGTPSGRRLEFDLFDLSLLEHDREIRIGPPGLLAEHELVAGAPQDGTHLRRGHARADLPLGRRGRGGGSSSGGGDERGCARRRGDGNRARGAARGHDGGTPAVRTLGLRPFGIVEGDLLLELRRARGALRVVAEEGVCDLA